MFSLVVVLISIALVAVFTAATTYYAGNSFLRQDASAEASTYLSQVEQIVGAARIMRATTGRDPAGIQDLVDNRYLRAQVQGGEGYWTEIAADVPAYILTGQANLRACQEFNRRVNQDSTVYVQAISDRRVQCYGAADPYHILVTGSASVDLQSLLPAHDPSHSVVGTVSQATPSVTP